MVTLGSMPLQDAQPTELPATALGHAARHPAAGAAWDALAGIWQLTQSGSPPDAIVWGIKALIDEKLPPQQGGWRDFRDWPPGRLRAGAGPAEAAGMVGGLLAWRRAPATGLFAELLPGEDIDVKIAGSRLRPFGADPGDEAAFGDAAGQQVYERDGLMLAGATVCAEITLRLLPGRLPAEAWAMIRAGDPCGKALGPYGMTRGRRLVRVNDLGPGTPLADPAVEAAALLTLDRRPVGSASERVTAGFIRRLAEAAA
jgi:hypothetical protein